jgi:hypothetical protein
MVVHADAYVDTCISIIGIWQGIKLVFFLPWMMEPQCHTPSLPEKPQCQRTKHRARSIGGALHKNIMFPASPTTHKLTWWSPHAARTWNHAVLGSPERQSWN